MHNQTVQLCSSFQLSPKWIFVKDDAFFLKKMNFQLFRIMLIIMVIIIMFLTVITCFNLCDDLLAIFIEKDSTTFVQWIVTHAIPHNRSTLIWIGTAQLTGLLAISTHQVLVPPNKEINRQRKVAEHDLIQGLYLPLTAAMLIITP